MHAIHRAAQPAQQPRAKRRREQQPERPQQLLAQGGERGALRRGRRVAKVARRPPGLLDRGGEAEARAVEARQRERRHQHGERKQQRLRARVPGPEPQPEMQPEAQVQPGDREQQRLLGGVPRIDPQRVHDPGVVDVASEQLPRQARSDHVRDEQRRQREAERDLQRLPGRHAQGPAAGERGQREREMREQRAVQEQRAGAAAPPQREPAAHRVHGAERNDAKRVIEEVAQEVRRQDKARREAQASLVARHAAMLPSRFGRCKLPALHRYRPGARGRKGGRTGRDPKERT